MRLRIAVTDNNWFRFLRGLPGVDEVNFWKPGGEQTFKALAPGEPLLFKLHSPEDFIVGVGFFVRFPLPPLELRLGFLRPEERDRDPGRDAAADREVPPPAGRPQRPDRPATAWGWGVAGEESGVRTSFRDRVEALR